MGGPKLTGNARFGRSIAPLADLDGDDIAGLVVAAVGDGSGAIHIIFVNGIDGDMDGSQP